MEMCQKHTSAQEAREALPYWLQRCKELEAENKEEIERHKRSIEASRAFTKETMAEIAALEARIKKLEDELIKEKAKGLSTDK
jgi:hypothetical protein